MLWSRLVLLRNEAEAGMQSTCKSAHYLQKHLVGGLLLRLHRPESSLLSLLLCLKYLLKSSSLLSQMALCISSSILLLSAMCVRKSSSDRHDLAFLFWAWAPIMARLPPLMHSSLSLLSVLWASDTSASAGVFMAESVSQDTLLESPPVFIKRNFSVTHVIILQKKINAVYTILCVCVRACVCDVMSLHQGKI